MMLRRFRTAKGKPDSFSFVPTLVFSVSFRAAGVHCCIGERSRARFGLISVAVIERFSRSQFSAARTNTTERDDMNPL